MKQKIAIIIAGSILVLSFSLTGCGSEQQTSSETESASQTVSQQSSSKTSSNINTSSQVINSVSKTVTVTIPEGFTWDLIAKRLEANEICSAEDFYQACQNYSPKSFNIPIDENRPFKMEGYLYPATYTFKKNSNAEDVLIEMLNAYRNNTGGNVTDTELIVASIVQMETRSPDHMSIIAGIIYNRLEQGMPLQMDSTREYINDYVTGNPLLGDTSKYAELYNTYKCAALPAGPICSPGADAISAAKNPTQTEYLYFFFGNDNENHYSTTYEEHQAAMAQFGVQYGESTE
ncbi:MAG: endolytic transglycosylase MltG [Clostridium sp.]|nr:endolytic transglycosylase MltG [Clostridium sp.]